LLADVRALIKKHLPKDRRERSTWRHVAGQLNKAAAEFRSNSPAVRKNAHSGSRLAASVILQVGLHDVAETINLLRSARPSGSADLLTPPNSIDLAALPRRRRPFDVLVISVS
jgi:hypothetical protein